MQLGFLLGKGKRIDLKRGSLVKNINCKLSEQISKMFPPRPYSASTLVVPTQAAVIGNGARKKHQQEEQLAPLQHRPPRPSSSLATTAPNCGMPAVFCRRCGLSILLYPRCTATGNLHREQEMQVHCMTGKSSKISEHHSSNSHSLLKQRPASTVGRREMSWAEVPISAETNGGKKRGPEEEINLKPPFLRQQRPHTAAANNNTQKVPLSYSSLPVLAMKEGECSKVGQKQLRPVTGDEDLVDLFNVSTDIYSYYPGSNPPKLKDLLAAQQKVNMWNMESSVGNPPFLSGSSSAGVFHSYNGANAGEGQSSSSFGLSSNILDASVEETLNVLAPPGKHSLEVIRYLKRLAIFIDKQLSPLEGLKRNEIEKACDSEFDERIFRRYSVHPLTQIVRKTRALTAEVEEGEKLLRMRLAFQSEKEWAQMRGKCRLDHDHVLTIHHPPPNPILKRKNEKEEGGRVRRGGKTEEKDGKQSLSVAALTLEEKAALIEKYAHSPPASFAVDTKKEANQQHVSEEISQEEGGRHQVADPQGLFTSHQPMALDHAIALLEDIDAKSDTDLLERNPDFYQLPNDNNREKSKKDEKEEEGSLLIKAHYTKSIRGVYALRVPHTHQESANPHLVSHSPEATRANLKHKLLLRENEREAKIRRIKQQRPFQWNRDVVETIKTEQIKEEVYQLTHLRETFLRDEVMDLEAREWRILKHGMEQQFIHPTKKRIVESTASSPKGGQQSNALEDYKDLLNGTADTKRELELNALISDAKAQSVFHWEVETREDLMDEERYVWHGDVIDVLEILRQRGEMPKALTPQEMYEKKMRIKREREQEGGKLRLKEEEGKQNYLSPTNEMRNNASSDQSIEEMDFEGILISNILDQEGQNWKHNFNIVRSDDEDDVSTSSVAYQLAAALAHARAVLTKVQQEDRYEIEEDEAMERGDLRDEFRYC